MTEVLVEQPLASPVSAKYMSPGYICGSDREPAVQARWYHGALLLRDLWSGLGGEGGVGEGWRVRPGAGCSHPVVTELLYIYGLAGGKSSLGRVQFWPLHC